MKNNPPSSRSTVLLPHFLDDFEFWIKTDRKTALHIIELLRAINKNPYTGIGKPEPLCFLGSDVWSRRITQEHRIVYVVYKDRTDFIQCRYHYDG